jgi:hypothetical protein
MDADGDLISTVHLLHLMAFNLTREAVQRQQALEKATRIPMTVVGQVPPVRPIDAVEENLDQPGGRGSHPGLDCPWKDWRYVVAAHEGRFPKGRKLSAEQVCKAARKVVHVRRGEDQTPAGSQQFATRPGQPTAGE